MTNMKMNTKMKQSKSIREKQFEQIASMAFFFLVLGLLTGIMSWYIMPYIWFFIVAQNKPDFNESKPKKYECPFKQNQLVVYDPRLTDERIPSDFPFKRGETVLFLGEITQMTGHCIVVKQSTGKVFYGYHTDNFRQPTEEEI